MMVVDSKRIRDHGVNSNIWETCAWGSNSTTRNNDNHNNNNNIIEIKF